MPIHLTNLVVDDQDVRFTQEPLEIGLVTIAVLNCTCGNLVQIVQHEPPSGG